MQSNWPTKKLGGVLEKIVGGGTPSKNNASYWGGNIPWASVKDIEEGVFVLRETEDHITEAGLKNSAANLIPKGAIVIATRMGLGRVVKTETETAINQDLKALFPKKELDTDYLLLFLRSHSQEIIKKGSGATVSGVRLEHIRDIEIPLPPILEQRKIVVKLEKLLAKTKEVKRLRAEAQEATKNLLSAELHKIFEEGEKRGWEEKQLSEISKVVTGGTPKTQITKYYGGEYLWARPGDLNEGLVVTTQKKLSSSGFEDGGVRPIPAGSVMMCCIGSIGKIGIASEEMSTNQQINSFIPDIQKINNRLLFYSLLYVRQEFTAGASSTTLKIINKSRCERIKIPLPPFVEQKKIVAHLDALSEKIRQLQEHQKSTASDFVALERSILHHAFSNTQ